MTFGAVFPRAMRPAFGPGLAAAAGNWWEAGGATGAVAVYQPKGAASLAASYTNLANPGTYDAAPGVAPTWDATNGWTFNGSTQWLNTGVTPVNNQTWSMIVRFSGVAATGFQVLAGMRVTDAAVFGFQWRNTNYSVYYQSGAGLEIIGAVSSGIVAVAGTTGYKDGIAQSGSIGAGTGAAFNATIGIGAANSAIGAQRFLASNIQALAIYNNNVAAYMSALVTAMAAL